MSLYIIVGVLTVGVIGIAAWAIIRGGSEPDDYLSLSTERMAMLVDRAHRESL